MTPKLTHAGRNLLLRSLFGDRINFTKIQFGNGPEQDSEKAEALISPIITSEITSITLGESYATLTVNLTNESLKNGFRITEIGFLPKILKMLAKKYFTQLVMKAKSQRIMYRTERVGFLKCNLKRSFLSEALKT